jgi:hypothetical protein
MSRYTIRKYEKGDEEDLSALNQAVWGFHTVDSLWTWKFFNNPQGNHYSYAALCDGKIVGFMGGMAWRLNILRNEYVGVQTTDLMIHPAYRIKGIFVSLNRKYMSEIAKKSDFHYGCTNPVSVKLYPKKYNMLPLHPQRLIKILKIKSLLWKQLKSGKGVKFPGFKALTRRFIGHRRESPSYGGLEVKEIKEFDQRFDDLWKRFVGFVDIATVRDSKYLNWRYVKHPQYNYKILAVEEANRPLGFIVLRVEEKEGIMNGLIVDILFDQERKVAAYFLLNETLKYFRSRSVALVRTWIFEHLFIYELLKEHGFSPELTHAYTTILIRSHTPDISSEFLADKRKWWFVMGDDDVL